MNFAVNSERFLLPAFFCLPPLAFVNLSKKFLSSLLKFLLKLIEYEVGFYRMGSDKRKGQNPYFSIDFGLS